MSILNASQAYCADLMGVTRWGGKSQSARTLLTYRSATPWIIEGLPDFSAIQKRGEPVSRQVSDALRETEANGFETQNSGQIDISQNQSVASLRRELMAEPEVVVEDLQPITELAVAIETPKPLKKGLPKTVHCFSFWVEKKLLLISDIPLAFRDIEQVEKLAFKMSQALLETTINSWQSSHFYWPNGLKNPQFLDRSDWMLGALESFIDRQIVEAVDPFLVVLAGQKVQLLIPELRQNQRLQQAKTAKIVSLPELYRIPEYKAEAWKCLQALIK